MEPSIWHVVLENPATHEKLLFTTKAVTKVQAGHNAGNWIMMNKGPNPGQWATLVTVGCETGGKCKTVEKLHLTPIEV